MGFRKIFWGNILLLFDFRLQGFDILPDFIGYILITIGLSEILNMNYKFQTARLMSIILIFISLFDIYVPQNSEQYNNNIILGLVITIIYLIFAFNLFTGIRDTAEKVGAHELSQKANLTWILIIIINICIYVGLVMPILGILLIIFSIIVFVMQLYTLSMASNVLTIGDNDNDY